MKGVAFRFDRNIPQVRSYSSKVSAGDAEALLGDLLRRAATAQEAAARFDKAIALQPPSARARALYGLLLVDSDQPGRALPLLLEAAKETSDWLVQYHVATGITRIVTTTDDADARAIATAPRSPGNRPFRAAGTGQCSRPQRSARCRRGRQHDARTRGHPAGANRLARPRGLHRARIVHSDAPGRDLRPRVSCSRR